MTRNFWAVLAAIALATEASAITVDGTLDEEYGEPITVQAVQTGFGDVLATDALGGSEIDAAYAKVEGSRLYLMLTGNHEPNFNKLEIFIDSIDGGENQLSDVPEYDYYAGDTPQNGLPWISRNLGGLTFDAGFTAEYHLFSRWGGGNTPGAYEADFVNRQGGTSAAVPASKGITDPSVGLVASGFITAGNVATYNFGPGAPSTALTQNLEFAIDNNNIAGVSGCSGGSGCTNADQVAAAAVTTGMEFSIALADIGNPAPNSEIRIVAIISNGDHNYFSNQSAAPFTAPQHNPGGSGNNAGNAFDGGAFTGTMTGMDFNNFAGTQYFTLIVPEAVVMPGDFNNDMRVDAGDYVRWRNNLGAPDESSLNNNGDGMNGVDVGDYSLWKMQYGEGFGLGGGGLVGSGQVPEPAAATMLFLALTIAGATRRRRR